MANQQALDRAESSPESRIGQNESPAGSPFDSLKLMGEAGKVLKNTGSKALEAFGLPTFSGAFETKSQAAPAEAKSVAAKAGTAAEAGASRAGAIQSGAETKAAEQTRPLLPKDGVAGKVIDRFKDSSNPVEDIKGALSKLDNLQNASVTRNGAYSHIDVNLKHGETSAPPNIQVRGFRPVASHTAPHLSFDLTSCNGGVALSNMEGFSSSVQGPLGRIRHSDTNSVFIGKDACGKPYVNTTSELYIGRRGHVSTTTLREENFPADSPMRSALHHPDALDSVSKALSLFQNRDDLSKFSIKNQADGFEVNSQFKTAKHVDLNYEYKPDYLPITVKVGSLDLDKNLTANLSQSENSVSLGKISGLTANVEIGKTKLSLCPTRVCLEKDVVKMELQNPQTGQMIPLEIPISKLREAAGKR